MNILVIGLGSMGKRRIRLLQEMYPYLSIYGVDGRKDRRNEVKELFDIKTVASIEEASKKFKIDSVFVCTSPLSHSSIIRQCLYNRWNVFTELNLVSDGYKENIELARENDCKLFLSSTFLYREEIKHIKNYISCEKKWNYIYHVGQYLPDWHPWENYKDFFVNDKRTNGCRELMAIELPWIVNIFGKVSTANVLADKITSLNIDYKDNFLIQITHSNGNKGILVVDVASPVAVRHFEAYTENGYIQWGGTPDTLFEYSKGSKSLEKVVLDEKEEHTDGYRSFIVENAYKNEIKEFMDVVEKGKNAIYGFEQDLEILSLIDTLEA